MVARKGVSFISHDKQQRKTAERVQSMTISNLSENVWGYEIQKIFFFDKYNGISSLDFMLKTENKT